MINQHTLSKVEEQLIKQRDRALAKADTAEERLWIRARSDLGLVVLNAEARSEQSSLEARLQALSELSDLSACLIVEALANMATGNKDTDRKTLNMLLSGASEMLTKQTKSRLVDVARGSTVIVHP